MSAATNLPPTQHPEASGAPSAPDDFSDRGITSVGTEPRRDRDSGPATLIGAIAVVLWLWVPGPPFTLEQFDIPKEAALAAVGVIAGLQIIAARDVPWKANRDLPIAVMVVWGIIAAWQIAPIRVVAFRSLGSFAATLLLFLLARRVGRDSGPDRVYAAICMAFAVCAMLVVLESYGALDLFSAPGRRPGGNFGNRNVAARVACLVMPTVWYQILQVKRDRHVAGYLSVAGLAAFVVVISRSRGALLVCGVVLLGLMVASFWHGIRRSSRSDQRMWKLLASVAIGATCAILLPNKLGWTPSDFLDSGRRLLEYDTGTGRGRIIQATTTIRMIADRAVLGVGPGNWSIVYPAYSLPGDPSVDRTAFYPAPKIARSDALSFAAEYGLPATGLMIAWLAGVLMKLRRGLTPEGNRSLSALVGASTVGAALGLGMFDSVLRVAPTATIVAVVVGLCLGRQDSMTEREVLAKGPWVLFRGTVLACAALAAVALNAATRDLLAFRIMRSAHSIPDLYHAVSVAPDNMEYRMTLAFVLVRQRRCDLAKPQLDAAGRIQPLSLAVSDYRVTCGESPLSHEAR